MASPRDGLRARFIRYPGGYRAIYFRDVLYMPGAQILDQNTPNSLGMSDF